MDYICITVSTIDPEVSLLFVIVKDALFQLFDTVALAVVQVSPIVESRNDDYWTFHTQKLFFFFF